MPVYEVMRFGVVGVIATVLHYIVLSTGVEFIGASPIPMTGIAFLCAMGVTYVGQSIWVFRVHCHRASRIIKFGVSAFVGLAANIIIMGVAVKLLQLNYTVGFVAGLILVPAITYLINKSWVFAE